MKSGFRSVRNYWATAVSTTVVESIPTAAESTTVSSTGVDSSLEVEHELRSKAETNKKNKFFIFLGFGF